MKRIILSICVITFMGGCSDNSNTYNEEEQENRIKLVESYNMNAMAIYEVDGVEYLVRRDGGILKLEK